MIKDVLLKAVHLFLYTFLYKVLYKKLYKILYKSEKDYNEQKSEKDYNEQNLSARESGIQVSQKVEVIR